MRKRTNLGFGPLFLVSNHKMSSPDFYDVFAAKLAEALGGFLVLGNPGHGTTFIEPIATGVEFDNHLEFTEVLFCGVFGLQDANKLKV